MPVRFFPCARHMLAAHKKFRFPAAHHVDLDSAFFSRGQFRIRHILDDDILHGDRFVRFGIQERVSVEIPYELIVCAVVAVFHMVQGRDERDVYLLHIRICRKIHIRVKGEKRIAPGTFVVDFFYRRLDIRIGNPDRLMPEYIVFRAPRSVHPGPHISAVFVRIDIGLVKAGHIRTAVVDIDGIPFVLDHLKIDPGRTDRPHLGGKGVVEYGRKPGVRRLDHRFVYDIRSLDAVLRPAGGFVVDLDLDGPVFPIARKAGGGGQGALRRGL